MAAKKSKIITYLQIAHLAVFLLGVTIVILLHVHTQGFLDELRLPTFLKEIDNFLGYAYPASLRVYQVILLFTLILSAIDSLGLFFYSSKTWKLLSDITSFLGLLIIWPTALFFMLTLASAQNLTQTSIQTILVYFSFTLFIFILDLVTWFVDEQSLIKIIPGKK